MKIKLFYLFVRLFSKELRVQSELAGYQELARISEDPSVTFFSDDHEDIAEDFASKVVYGRYL